MLMTFQIIFYCAMLAFIIMLMTLYFTKLAVNTTKGAEVLPTDINTVYEWSIN